ncbi:hypothetical protein D9613_001041 [Agrocybe pediades]|uniref:Uncharacterized protein n=1 Tax=Agrocybe pediades TaxID=84607 RepID=A0A8H4VSS7_9AGAR|nr:hypothetical protein D9613_001041 [Agrocybe pediades]
MTSSQQKMDAFADDTDPRIVYGGPWKSVKNLDTTSPPQDLLGSSSPLFGTLHTLDAADVVGQGTPLTLAFTYSGNAFNALFHMSETSGISSCTLDNMTQPISTGDSLTGKVSCSGGTSARMGLHSLVITFNPAPTARVQFDGIFYTPDDPGDPEENIVAYYNGTGLVGYGGLLSLDMTIPPGFSIGIYVDYTFSPDNVAPAQLSYTVGDFEAPVHFSTTNPCNSTNPTILSQLLIQAPRTQENFTDFHLAYYSPFAVYAVNQTKFRVSFMIVQNTPVPGTQLQIVPPLSSSTSSSSTSTSSSMTTTSTPIMSTVPPTSGPVTHSKSHAIAIGAGTGAAIIALLFAGSIFYLWRRRMAAAESRLVVTDNSAWPRPYYPKRDETAQVPPSKVVMCRLWPQARASQSQARNRPSQARPEGPAWSGFWPGFIFSRPEAPAWATAWVYRGCISKTGNYVENK